MINPNLPSLKSLRKSSRYAWFPDMAISIRKTFSYSGTSGTSWTISKVSKCLCAMKRTSPSSIAASCADYVSVPVGMSMARMFSLSADEASTASWFSTHPPASLATASYQPPTRRYPFALWAQSCQNIVVMKNLLVNACMTTNRSAWSVTWQRTTLRMTHRGTAIK